MHMKYTVFKCALPSKAMGAAALQDASGAGDSAVTSKVAWTHQLCSVLHGGYEDQLRSAKLGQSRHHNVNGTAIQNTIASAQSGQAPPTSPTPKAERTDSAPAARQNGTKGQHVHPKPRQRVISLHDTTAAANSRTTMHVRRAYTDATVDLYIPKIGCTLIGRDLPVNAQACIGGEPEHNCEQARPQLQQQACMQCGIEAWHHRVTRGQAYTAQCTHDQPHEANVNPEQAPQPQLVPRGEDQRTQ